MSNSKNEIILYQLNEVAEHIEVRLGNETVWLNRNQMATLFGRDVKTIGKHINNVFNEGELNKEVVVAKYATTTKHGAIEGKTQASNNHYPYYLNGLNKNVMGLANSIAENFKELAI